MLASVAVFIASKITIFFTINQISTAYGCGNIIVIIKKQFFLFIAPPITASSAVFNELYTTSVVGPAPSPPPAKGLSWRRNEGNNGF